ncbi:hypothetical protein SO802_015003 [Lithocarpus litseifolius]|uniref:Uncharacterized protein n=1 Tax=Lithocarpus litseifolius TaxID=425828 RepID=A0AAW2CSI7_9ROSI
MLTTSEAGSRRMATRGWCRRRLMVVGDGRKRLFSGKGSKFMGHEIFEIPPQFFWSSKMHKQKQVIPRDVIDIDKGGDSADVMFIDRKVHTRNTLQSNKGKKIKDVSDGYGGHQAKVMNCKLVEVP